MLNSAKASAAQEHRSACSKRGCLSLWPSVLNLKPSCRQAASGRFSPDTRAGGKLHARAAQATRAGAGAGAGAGAMIVTAAGAGPGPVLFLALTLAPASLPLACAR